MNINITVQYIEECPHFEATYSMLAGILDELDVNAVLKTERIETPEQAESAHFRGSPTILVDGKDLFASQAGPVALACRIYHSEEGESGMPPAGVVRDHLRLHT